MSKLFRNKGKKCLFDGCDREASCRHYCHNHYQNLRVYGKPEGVGTPQGLNTKFMLDHVAYEGDDCLIWPFGRNQEGYGKFRKFYGEGAHRNMCFLAHGEAPSNKHVAAHSCGNGHLGCVNPKHLRWATKKENAMDRKLHGTEYKGEGHHKSKLTEEKVLEILSLKDKLSVGELSKRYGVNGSSIWYIFQGRSWAWLSSGKGE